MKMDRIALGISLMSSFLLVAQESVPPKTENVEPYAPPVSSGRRHQPAEIPRVSEKLRRKIATDPGEVLPLIVVLSEQPASTIRRALEERHRLRLDSIAHNISTSRTAGRTQEVQRAILAENDFTVQFRQELLREARDRTEPIQREMTAELERLGGQSIRNMHALNIMRVDLPAAAVTELEQDPRIAEIGLDEPQQAHIINSMPALGMYSLWSLNYFGFGQSVLILDSGINFNHPAFGTRVLGGVFLDANSGCSAQERASFFDYNGHGTHVAGIIGSAGTNSFPGYWGAAPFSNLYIAKISCSNGTSTVFDPLLAVQATLSITPPVRIVNNSNGGAPLVEDDLYSRLIDQYVETYDLLWVNSAGNLGPSTFSVTSPGTAYNTISVAAMDTFGSTNRALASVANYSSRGPTIGGRFKPDIAAPGSNIASTSHLSAGYRLESGTSMAAPHIAGAAAVLRERTGLGKLGLKALLLNSTDTYGWNAATGWGFANISRAVEQAGNVSNGSLGTQAGSLALFKGVLPATKALYGTLTWNRFVRGNASFVRDLDFRAYNIASGIELATSAITTGNVEQITVPATLTDRAVAIRVTSFNGGYGFTEPFAMALSEAGFQPASGILLQSDCVAPVAVVAGAAFSLACTFRNLGDLSALTAAYETGSLGTLTPLVVSIGSLAPGAAVTGTVPYIASGTPGTYSNYVALAGTGYGISATALPVTASIQVVSPTNVTLSALTASAPAAGISGKRITVGVTPSALSWTAQSQSAWLSITAGLSGAGNGQVVYNVAPNPGASSRTGTLLIGGRTVSVTQAGTAGAQPVGITPALGSSGRQVFSYVVRHATSANSVLYSQFLFSKAGLVAQNSCYVSYDPTANVFYLLNDTATGWFGLLGGTPNTVGNSQCTLYGAASGSSKAGTDLTINLDVSFRTGFAGTKTAYLLAGDNVGLVSDWQEVGSSSDSGDARAVEITSFAPLSGNGPFQTFSAGVRDADGANTIAFVQFVMNAGLNGFNACFIHYDRASNAFFLLKDDASGWFGLVGGSAAQVENSQCVLRGVGSGGTSTVDTLSINYNLQFKTAFTGSRNIYLQAVDNTGVIQSWKQAGTWTVSGATLASASGPAPMTARNRGGNSLSAPAAPAFETPRQYQVIQQGDVLLVGPEEADPASPGAARESKRNRVEQ